MVVVGYILIIVTWIIMLGMLAPQGGGVAVLLIYLGLIVILLFALWVNKRQRLRRKYHHRELMLVEQEQANHQYASANSTQDAHLIEEMQRLAKQGYHYSERLDNGKDFPLPDWMPKEFHKHW
jgi:type VI protein secretion system component VasK